jgi:hypothetical protein
MTETEEFKRSTVPPTDKNRIVELDATTRVGQAAICAALQLLSPPYQRRNEIPELVALRSRLYAAIQDMNVDRCVVASDGEEFKILHVHGTPQLHMDFSDGMTECYLSAPSARGLWIYEGRLETFLCRTFESEEWDTSFAGEYREITEEDRQTMDFDDDTMKEDAQHHNIDVSV